MHDPDDNLAVVAAAGSETWRRARTRASLLGQRMWGRRPGSSGAFASPVEGAVRDRIAESDVGRLFLEHRGTTIHKWSHYFEVYARELAPWRDGVETDEGRRPVRFLEIGVSHGGSLQMWRRYLGPEATIVGVDIDPRCSRFDGEAATVRIGSQTDAAFLRSVVDEMGGVDIVLDDGSHVARHQRASFDVLFPLLADGGLYVVEDVHTSYWSNFGGGLRRRGTWIEQTKAVIDDVHRPYHRRRTRALPEGSGVARVTVHDSITVFEKRRPTPPASVRSGEPAW